MAAVREFSAHVILTYDDDGGYPHPDHIMEPTRVSVEAFEGEPATPTATRLRRALAAPEALLPHGFTKERFEALHEAMNSRGIGSPYAEWISRWEDRPQSGR
ncbi:hypothetical protein GCM10018952_75420 [Streptosporangium vulgare]